MIGITPMIGVNDDGTTFTFDDAQRVADFTRQQGYGLLTYWSFQRDVAQSSAGGALSRYSSVVQGNYQYLNIFKTAGNSTLPGTAPPPTTVTESPCAYPAWVLNKAYLANDIVSYSNGKLYKAKYANPGYDPTISTYYWAEHACVAPAPEPAPAPAPAPVCATSYPAWVQGRAYLAGDIVKYTNGSPYIAKLANPGYDPSVSTDYWASYNCTAAPAPAPAPVCTSADWKRGTTYAAGAMVHYSSKLYKATVPNRNQTPADTSKYWAASGC
jgi:chitinase